MTSEVDPVAGERPPEGQQLAVVRRAVFRDVAPQRRSVVVVFRRNFPQGLWLSDMPFGGLHSSNSIVAGAQSDLQVIVLCRDEILVVAAQGEKNGPPQEPRTHVLGIVYIAVAFQVPDLRPEADRWVRSIRDDDSVSARTNLIDRFLDDVAFEDEVGIDEVHEFPVADASAGIRLVTSFRTQDEDSVRVSLRDLDRLVGAVIVDDDDLKCRIRLRRDGT